jgi:hypothetical protein
MSYLSRGNRENYTAAQHEGEAAGGGRQQGLGLPTITDGDRTPDAMGEALLGEGLMDGALLALGPAGILGIFRFCGAVEALN